MQKMVWNNIIANNSFMLLKQSSGKTYINCTTNTGLKVSEKSVFQTSFGCDDFQGNLFSFEKQVVTKDFT